MCGIFGLVQPGPFSGAELISMNRNLRYRGPDDEGFLVLSREGASVFGGSDTPGAVLECQMEHAPRERLQPGWRSASGGVALGHRRLSIVDLSPSGHQPMCYRNRAWISYNGEIYNHVELREELGLLGHRFAGSSDTEVILAAYDEWGTGCLSRFNGMWGLAIYDARRDTLFVARDRFGIKPVYYRVAEGRLAFASEIKAFAAMDGWRPKANMARVLDFLAWNLSDHTAETMFEGVLQLPAGHCFLLEVGRFLQAGHSGAEASVKPTRWYSLPGADAPGPADAAGALREALDDAVRLRLRADVPVGSCLSGGVDSSAIVCLMGGQLDRAGVAGTLKTFTAKSADGRFDESRFAEMVAASTRAQGHFVTPQAKGLLDQLPRVAWHQDEPFASTSIYAQWCVFELARRNGVTVMLDGQGADEILCGYRGFVGAYLAGLARDRRLGPWLGEARSIQREIGFSLARSAGYTAAYLWPGLLKLFGRFDNREFSDRGWLAPGARSAFSTDPILALGGRPRSLREMSVAQVTSTNLPRLLHWEDRNSMAFSVEARLPFLDYRVVEMCLNMADSEKLGGGVPKAALRHGMRGIVPDAVLDRRDKMGFLTAEPLWMKRDLPGQFRDEISTALEVLPGVVDPSILARFDQVASGRRPFDGRYWRVISTAHWVRAHSVSL